MKNKRISYLFIFTGWLYIGDRGYIDKDGYIWFVGRADDVIISSGYRIGPFEVESILIEHDAVAESAVISSPCEERGEIVKAFIVLNERFIDHDENLLKKEIQQFVKKMTAPYKYPRRVCRTLCLIFLFMQSFVSFLLSYIFIFFIRLNLSTLFPKL